MQETWIDINCPKFHNIEKIEDLVEGDFHKIKLPQGTDVSAFIDKGVVVESLPTEIQRRTTEKLTDSPNELLAYWCTQKGLNLAEHMECMDNLC